MGLKRAVRSQAGFTIIEVLIASAILAVMVSSLVVLRTFMAKQTLKTQQYVMASGKAMQLMEELRSLVAANEKTGLLALDGYNQADPADASAPISLKYSYYLTTSPDASVTAAGPSHPLSGNKMINGKWLYARNIQVDQPPNTSDDNIRRVRIRIYNAESVSITGAPKPLVEVASIMRTGISARVPSQVYDIYVLALENIPGWWSSLTTMKPIFDNVAQDIMDRNPGFAPRLHYITRLAFGRDPEYAPYFNVTTSTAAATMPWVYFYPDLTLATDGTTTTYNQNYEYFTASWVGGQHYEDNALTKAVTWGTGTGPGGSYPGKLPDGSTLNFAVDPSKYSLADQWNTAVRWPDEKRQYDAWCDYNNARVPPVPTPEPSLRMLMEDMCNTLTAYKYQNAMILNLHGELMVEPPLRNYSDGAACPDGIENPSGPFPSSAAATAQVTYASAVSLMYARVVTHPEQLQYPATLLAPVNSATTPTLPVTLRVYPFVTEYAGQAASNSYRVPVISIYLPNDKLTDVSPIVVTKIQGYSGDAGTPNNYASFTATLGTHYQLSSPHGNDTLIELYNTNFRHLATSSSNLYRGLGSAARRYGLEYIPCPVGTNFATTWDLDAATKVSGGVTFQNIPRNTSRWIITMNLSTKATDASGNAINPHTIETRFGSPSASFSVGGLGWSPTTVTVGPGLNTYAEGVTHDLQNISRTYVWVGQIAPFTERYQYLGDPRDCPYQDVINDDRYNWFFCDPTVNTSSGGSTFYTAFPNAQAYGAGYNDTQGHNSNVDLPKYFLANRTGLLNTQSIWTVLNGWSYYYLGIGGEFGGDQQPFPDAVTFHDDRPWRASNTPTTNGINADEIAHWTNSDVQKHSIAVQSSTASGSLVANPTHPWIGLLFRDSDYSTYWKKGGSALAGGGNLPTGIGNYYRASWDDANAGVYTSRYVGGIMGPPGCGTFFNGVNSSNQGPFNHTSGSTNCNMTALGANLGNLFNLPLPAQVLVTRPFKIAGSGTPPGYNEPEYAATPIASQTPGYRTVLMVPTPKATPRIYYDWDPDTTYDSSSVIQMKLDKQFCYVVVNGLAPSGDVGRSLLGKMILISMMRTFFDAGLYGTPTGTVTPGSYGAHITQLPMVQIGSPQNASIAKAPSNAVTVSWSLGWTKWAGQAYTEEYPVPTATPYSESVSMTYALMFSSDDKTWAYVQDNTPAITGVAPSASHAISLTTYTVDVTNWANKTTQYLRVEAYRKNFNLHYSYHEVQFFLDK